MSLLASSSLPSVRPPLLWFLLFFLPTLALAQESSEPNRSRPFAPGACGPVDSTYIRVAEESGGIPMFFQRSEVAKSMDFMQVSTGENQVTLLWAKGALAGSAREFAIPVDSTLERLTFTLSTDTAGTAMEVLGPAGTPVAAGAPGAKVTELNCGRFVTLARPEPGEWRVVIQGSGRFWFEAEGKSEIFITTVEFVAPGGRIGHQGLFRIPGQPVADRPAMLEARLSGPIQEVSFRLISPEGNTIKPLEMRIVDESGDSREYLGTFELPNAPFRIAAKGPGSSGEAFERIFHSLFHAESVEVSPTDRFQQLPPGQTAPVIFVVRNAGPARTFRALAADSRRWLARAEPQELRLETGASAKVTVEMAVPEGSPRGSDVTITLTASSTSGPPTTNGASVNLEVSSPHQP